MGDSQARDARETDGGGRRQGVVAHHMKVRWQESMADGELTVGEATLEERSAIVGRLGLMMLSVGTGAWRVLDSMDTVARAMGMTCTADVGLVSLSYTCIADGQAHAASLALPTTGINTEKLRMLEVFAREFEVYGRRMTLQEVHDCLDEIEQIPGFYSPFQGGLSAGFACCAFTFLLGGGLVEMVCALIGAFVGNWSRRHMLARRLSLVPNVMASVALDCCACIASYRILEAALGLPIEHEAGYICAMLFIIPGFPLITGGIDLAKSHMRSGLERLAYALTIITVATFTGWIVAQFLGFQPGDLVKVEMDPLVRCLLRLAASFVGVYGFSQMYNSSPRMAATAGCIGAVANTLRLELVDLAGLAPAVAAFVGALTAGLLAAAVHGRMGYPRISVSVPSIVIMVPGMYMYKAIYYLATGSSADGATWLFGAVFIVLALPLGLIVARTLTDKRFRVCS